ncbi:thioredoxin family protein [Mitsuaria sp. WAJ17]|uniref:thioredoxin family protein n=1 Tax=Mitsuaria sp. WAJ17 TaxID=2761452 RepID=UPI001601C93E|nr:thioredoxin family protein [Mitsuaria sp. WAJ17]MBB2485032.1 thioredoxin family protein [Mitsuaria sp. WAJ17]
MNSPLLRPLGILALAAGCQALWAGEATTLTPETWRALQRQTTRPTVVLFSATYCSTCPRAVEALDRFRQAKAQPIQLITVVMDADEQALPSPSAHSRGHPGDRAFRPGPSAQALQFAVDPRWRGETPRLVLLRPGAGRRDLLGIPSTEQLDWLLDKPSH